MPPRATARLPKAPLAEAVFELRWKLQGDKNIPGVMHSDPALLPLIENFTSRIKKRGFLHFRDMSPALQTGAYGVARRYYRSSDKPFPLMQIGPGIFATNEGPQYDWKSFRGQIASGLETLFASYPKVGFFPLTPNFLELRYVDAFSKGLAGTAAIFSFLEKGTSMKIAFPSLLEDRKVFEGDAKGRILFQRRLKGYKNANFSVDIASGRDTDKNEDIVRMETKIRMEDSDLPTLKEPKRFIASIATLLDSAHEVTSSFFKTFVTSQVMGKFG